MKSTHVSFSKVKMTLYLNFAEKKRKKNYDCVKVAHFLLILNPEILKMKALIYKFIITYLRLHITEYL